MGDATRITVDKQMPGYWRVTLNHPPINTIDEQMYDKLFDLVEAMDADPSLKVVTFESANPDFFLAHYGIGESKSRFDTPRWIETAERLARSSVLSIAIIRGERAEEAVSSRWLAISGSPAKRGPSSASPRWDSDSFQAAAPSNGSRSLLAVPEQSKSSSAPTTSMPRQPTDMAGSIAPSPTPSSIDSSPSLSDGSCPSIARHWPPARRSSIRRACPTRPSFKRHKRRSARPSRSPWLWNGWPRLVELGLGAAGEFELNLGGDVGGF